MHILFEYGEQITVPNRKDLEIYLYSIWHNYKDLWPKVPDEKVDVANKEYQPFLSFDGNYAKANNYVGFVNFEGLTIEIYPKVFQFMPILDKGLMHNHLLFWFSYCKKVKFPFNQSFLENSNIESLPELIIYLISKQIYDTISAQPFMAYEEIEESLWFPKGRINFNRYTNSLAHGKNHLIDCDHQPFLFDNSLNRTIKYCARLLKSITELQTNQQLLDEVLFILDEVEDTVQTVNQLNQINVSSLFTGYEEVVQSCRMILENQIYSYSQFEMKNWSLFFPMEFIFEDFISGFIQTNFSKEYLIEPQKSDLYLHQSPKTFNLQHDILLTHKVTNDKIIIDTKYKPRWGLLSSDNKKGVSQIDLYQMISYSYRRGIKKVLLIYPNTSEQLADDFTFIIENANSKEEIKIKVIDVPFWSSTDFTKIKQTLLTKLTNVFGNEF
ncbi:restriction endonuclease [Mucilaginibacter sp. 44-25]|uniref:McrC family protein n=1 Tax=Mucilaginibacter sp. 44-25 TaxID=1895794 RepID=UPI00095FF8E9|nr:restriction endonuclease [Mucilaginibacter sp. 44-25]OJW13558.1 MAG: hypothetical protein BGO48_02055 [Mucilaginibacter sp. 44-25]